MIRQTKIFVFLFALLLIGGNIYAQTPSEGSPRQKFEFHHPNIFNLTVEQKTKLHDLWKKFFKETVFLRNDIRVKRLELEALWMVPAPDKEKIIAKEKELINLTTQLKLKAIDFRIEAKSYLTPEQAAQAGLWGSKIWRMGGHKGLKMRAGHPWRHDIY